MRPETIHETMRLWETQPDKARGKPAVKARSDGSLAILESGTFSWKTDLPPSLGGSDAAPSPTAPLLSALAGCAVVFIRDTLAPQLGVRLESLQATAECETDSRGLLGMGAAAPDLQNIRLSVRLQSPDKEEKVRKLYQVWQGRCPIYLALTKQGDARRTRCACRKGAHGKRPS
jgi:uncharacterized OsmC-like protein